MSRPQQPEEARGEARDWNGNVILDRDGSRVGRLEHVYLDRDSDAPTWGVVKAGRKHPFVPLHNATASKGMIQVPVSRRQVESVPAVASETDLDPDTEATLSRHYSQTDEREHAPRGSSSLAVRRSRGAVSGGLLVLLGAWGALIPFVGPYFGYTFGTTAPWLFTFDRLWLNILPGIAVLLGGLMLGPSANRVSGSLGAELAMAGGIWFLIGPSLSQLWGTGGPGAPIGAPTGPPVLQVLEQIGFFYGLGALATALSAFALGRLAGRSVKD